MKTATKYLIVILSLLIAGLLSACEDDEESADALGRVANESAYDLEDITYGDAEIGDCDADETTDYVGIPLQSERLKFTVSGFSGTVETDRFDPPEEGKKYTVEITAELYYSTVYFYYEWFEDGEMRSVSQKNILFEAQMPE